MPLWREAKDGARDCVGFVSITAPISRATDRDYKRFAQLLLEAAKHLGDIWLPRIELQETLKVETAHFLHCVETGEPPLTGPQHARSAVSVLEAGHRSLRTQAQAVTLQTETMVYA